MRSNPSVTLWSAVPTPLDAKFEVDVTSVERLIRDAIAARMTGVFLAGTCGEGPWLPDREKSRLIEAAVQAAEGKLTIATQVTDNSVPRVLDNIQKAYRAGATVAIMATPSVFLNPTEDRITALFREVAANSPLPMGIYDLGHHRTVVIPEKRLLELYLLPRVHLVKDSSGSPERRAIALKAKEARPELQLFNGDEFKGLEYLTAGYDGCLFGGAVAVPAEMHQLVSLFRSGQLEEARGVEQRMRNLLYGIYGGEKIECWLTGLKYHLVKRRLFTSASSLLGYPLTESCRRFIEEDIVARWGKSV